MEAIITKARLTADQTPPEGVALVAMIEAWAEALEDIPLEMLDEYYVRALKAKTNSFAVNALDIIAAWNKRAEMRHNEQLLADQIAGRLPWQIRQFGPPPLEPDDYE